MFVPEERFRLDIRLHPVVSRWDIRMFKLEMTVSPESWSKMFETIWKTNSKLMVHLYLVIFQEFDINAINIDHK